MRRLIDVSCLAITAAALAWALVAWPGFGPAAPEAGAVATTESREVGS